MRHCRHCILTVLMLLLPLPARAPTWAAQACMVVSSVGVHGKEPRMEHALQHTWAGCTQP